MAKLFEFLEGKKTIIGALILALAGVLRVFGVIGQEQEEALRNIGMGIATIGLYHFLARSMNKK